MINRELRDYEISVWSLQDEFITVLKPSGYEYKGQTQNAEMTLNIDGTQELSFEIPMYLYRNGEKIENPAWYNAKNNSIVITGMRKIKVIVNKKTEDEEVFEFVIVKVTEKHENDELICSVECEGLAFHELGKTGFKISLTEEDYNNDVAAYDENGVWGDGEEEPPVNNINYWLNKFLLTEDQAENTQQWYYTINMDWSSFDNAAEKDSDKIYENPYIASYNFDTVNDELVVTPARIEDSREKCRLVNLEESNRYNLTQDLAEAFEVYCRYIYHYDENYYIIGREVQFYNNYFGEDENTFDLTYKYNSSSISRESDSTELITKMYVKSAEMESDLDSEVTIIDVDANLSGEDYILNFDYLKTIGAISDDSYAEVKKFEKQIGKLNRELRPVSNIINLLSNKINELEAEITTYTDAVTLDTTQRDELTARIQAKVNSESGVGHRGSDNRYQALARKDSSTGLYYVDIGQEGVKDNDNLKVFHRGSSVGFSRTPDKYGYIVRVYNIKLPNNTVNFNIYIEFDYTADGYLMALQNDWENKRSKDIEQVEKLTQKQDNYQKLLDKYTESYNIKLREKRALIENFEKTMGPALREGYWQPEEFHDYGDRITNNFDLISNNTQGDGIVSLLWDSPNTDEGEKDLYEVVGIAQETTFYYPCIKLAGENAGDALSKLINNKEQLWRLRVYFPNGTEGVTDANPSYWSFLNIDADCEFGFIKSINDNTITPAIILTGTSTYTSQQLEKLRTGWKVGILDFKVNDTDTTIEKEQEIWLDSNKAVYISPNSVKTNYERVYPRLVVKSDKLKTGEGDIYLSVNGTELEEFEDYSIFIRDDMPETIDETTVISDINIDYYITIKADSYIKNLIVKNSVLQSNLVSKLTLSNAATAIYLDALTVSKDSAYPQVSYEIDVNVFNKKFLKKVAGILGHIAHINDYELKFDHVLGYVSELTLNLDKPWEDSIEIKNYKTKFEDLFQKIVAQTESMKKQSYLLNTITQAFTANGEIKSEIIQKTFTRADLNYAFNQGALTINETDGIWGTSDQGVVAFRGGGIFTATQKDSAGNWIWNTGILPSGIDASAIKTGQLDTNRINVYAGDDIRFQWNGEGIFAYKEISDINGVITADEYVQYNSDGLSLMIKEGTQYGNSLENVTTQDIKRVELSWNGLILRNYNNQAVFEADPDTGNLTITGDITATSGTIGDGDNKLYIGTQTYGDVSFGYIGNASNYLDATLGFRAIPSNNNDWASLWIGGTATGGQYPCNNAPFRVTRDGTLYTSNAVITGGMLQMTDSDNGFTKITISNNALDGMFKITSYDEETNLKVESGMYIPLYGSSRIWPETFTQLYLDGGDNNHCITKIENGYLYIQAKYENFQEGHLCFDGGGFIVKSDTNNKSFLAQLSTGNFTINGEAIVTGGKSRLISTSQYSDRLLYCYETPTPMFGDIGEGIIGQDGLCYISFDSIFAQTVITNQYQVFLQPYGEGNCWVKTRTSSWFVVEGTPGLKFGWEIKAKQRDYDQLRLEKYEQDPYTIPQQTYGTDAANYIDELRQGRITQ